LAADLKDQHFSVIGRRYDQWKNFSRLIFLGGSKRFGEDLDFADKNENMYMPWTCT
jgi:hypothetical protein